jgi:hypothetical protein
MGDGESEPQGAHSVRPLVEDVRALLADSDPKLRYGLLISPVGGGKLLVLGVIALGIIAYGAFWARPEANTQTLALTGAAALVLAVLLICETVLRHSVITAKAERDIRLMEAFADVLRATHKSDKGRTLDRTARPPG